MVRGTDYAEFQHVVELMPCDSQAIGCQATSVKGKRWTSGLDVMRHIVLDRTIRSTGPCHSRKLRQQSEEGVA